MIAIPGLLLGAKESKTAAMREFERSERRAPRGADCEKFPSGNLFVADSPYPLKNIHWKNLI